MLESFKWPATVRTFRPDATAIPSTGHACTVAWSFQRQFLPNPFKRRSRLARAHPEDNGPAKIDACGVYNRILSHYPATTSLWRGQNAASLCGGYSHSDAQSLVLSISQIRVTASQDRFN